MRCGRTGARDPRGKTLKGKRNMERIRIRNRIAAALLAALAACLLLSGCSQLGEALPEIAGALQDGGNLPSQEGQDLPELPVAGETGPGENAPGLDLSAFGLGPDTAPDPTATPKPTKAPKKTATPKPEKTPGVAVPDEHGWYSSKEDVAAYLIAYGHLPENYLTKKEAEALGWTGGSLEPYAPGKSIGGDYFGNYEGLLPKAKGRRYTECDIDTQGKRSRGGKRIVFSNDGLIYYTADHYESFTLIYGG